MSERIGDWCCTYSGKKSWPEDPRPEDIDIVDVAHALSMLCRFGGHTRFFYSVAQHSVMVSHICDPADALWGLLHDASEAYLVDVPRPAKLSTHMAGYRHLEERMLWAVMDRFGLPRRMPESVRRADDVMLATEARDLMPTHLLGEWSITEKPRVGQLVVWPPDRARQRFLDRFNQLVPAEWAVVRR